MRAPAGVPAAERRPVAREAKFPAPNGYLGAMAAVEDEFAEFWRRLEDGGDAVLDSGPIVVFRRQRVLWAALDAKDAKLNVIDRRLGDALRETVKFVEQYAAAEPVGALVLVSRKRGSFVVGADIKLQVRARAACGAARPRAAAELPTLSRSTASASATSCTLCAGSCRRR